MTNESISSSTLRTVEDNSLANVLFAGAEAVLSAAMTADPKQDGLVIKNITAEGFQSVEAARDGSGQRLKLFFLEHLSMLIVTIPTRQHEVAAGRMYENMFAQICSMGLADDWEGTYSTRYQSRVRGSSSGEGDQGGLPVSMRPDANDWPTMVIEAGYSQTLDSLRAKMRFWFYDSGHKVKVVILVKAIDTEKRIRIEHWQERLPAGTTALRTGATTPRASATGSALAPVCLQTIKVSWTGQQPFSIASVAERRNPDSYTVVRGPLEVDFPAVFLRAPTRPAEHAFVITDAQLRSCAARVWVDL